MEHSFGHAYFCIYDTIVQKSAVYVKVLNEGQSKHRVAAFFFN